MLPEELHGRYVSYHIAQDSVVQYLVTTALSMGYQMTALEEHRRAPGMRDYDLSVEIFLDLVEYIVSPATSNLEVPMYIIRLLEDTVSGRKYIANQLQKRGREIDHGHLEFIRVLQDSLESLRPHVARLPESSPQQEDHTSNMMSNVFQLLTMHDGSIDNVSSIPTNPVKYTKPKPSTFRLKPQESITEAYLAISDIFSLTHMIESSILDAWRIVYTTEQDYHVAAVVTNACFALVKTEWAKMEELIHRYGGAIQVARTTIFEAFNNTDSDYTGLVEGITLWDEILRLCTSNTTGYKPKQGHPRWVKDWVQPKHQHQEKDREDQSDDHVPFCVKLLPELFLLSRKEGQETAYDEWTNMMCEAIRTGKIPFTLTLTTHIYAQILDLLGDKVTCVHEELAGSSEGMLSTINNVMGIQAQARSPNWSKEQDKAFLDMITEIEETALRDPVYRPGQKHRWKLRQQNLYQNQPLLCGTILFRLKIRYQMISVEFTNAYGAVIRAAHLYRACTETYEITKPWEYMDLLLYAQPESSMFVGDTTSIVSAPAESPEERRLRLYCLAMGASPTLWAQNRRMNLPVASTTTEARVKKIHIMAPFSQRLLCHLEDKQGDYSFNMVDIYSLLQLDKARLKKLNSMSNLLGQLTAQLQEESMSLDIDLLSIHCHAMEHFQTVKEEIEPILRRSEYPYYMHQPHEVYNIA